MVSHEAVNKCNQPASHIQVLGISFVWIPAGEFLMGTPDTDPYLRRDETPQHKVIISKGFYIGQYPVTQKQYENITGRNIADTKDPLCPVESVTRVTALEFCRLCTDQSGINVCLPTEAQWEYACRSGTETRYFWGDDSREMDDCAWYRDNSNNRIHPVGCKKPNSWVLYDMLGNVWEWCSDWYSADYYSTSPLADPEGPSSGERAIVRGGSFINDISRLGCASRGIAFPEVGRNRYGIRLCINDLKEKA